MDNKECIFCREIDLLILTTNAGSCFCHSLTFSKEVDSSPT